MTLANHNHPIKVHDERYAKQKIKGKFSRLSYEIQDRETKESFILEKSKKNLINLKKLEANR